MRIVIDLQACQNGSRYRGIGRYALNFVKAMLSAGSTHEFFIVLTDCFPSSIDFLRKELKNLISQDAILICSVLEGTSSTNPNNAWRNRASEILRSAFIAQLKPDMVIISSLFEGFGDNTVISIDTAPYLTAVILYDLIPLEDPDRYIPFQNDRDAYFLRLKDTKRADLLIAISSFVAEEAKRYIAADPQKLIVAHGDFDHKLTNLVKKKIDHNALMRSMGISRPFVFNTSPFEYRKNLEGLISAFSAMPKEVRERYQLVIAGKMDEYDRNCLRELASVNGLPVDALVMPGYVSDENLAFLYVNCALFAFPSWSEGFGIPPLEAMGLGAPVIASKTTSLPEIIGDAGILVDPKDIKKFSTEMAAILTDLTLQQKLRSLGPLQAKKFSWERSAHITLKAFEKIYFDHKTQYPTKTIALNRPIIAFVCLQVSMHSHVAGRLSDLIAILSTQSDVTLICPNDLPIDPWISAQVECRDINWLSWNASRFDQIIYAGDDSSLPDLIPIMESYSGIYIYIRSLKIETPNPIGIDDLPSSIYRYIIANNGLGGLIKITNNFLDKNDDIRLNGENFYLSGILTFVEGDKNLPLLPITGNGKAAEEYLKLIKISNQKPLIVVVVSQSNTARSIMSAYYSLMVQKKIDAYMAIHVLEEEFKDEESIVKIKKNICQIFGSLNSYYRGILSATDLLVIGSDLPKNLSDRFINDAKNLRKKTILMANIEDNLILRIEEIFLAINKNKKKLPMSIKLAPQKSAKIWVNLIMAAIEKRMRVMPSQIAYVGKNLPRSVRGVQPSSRDIGLLSIALNKNTTIERKPRIYIDITAYAGSEAVRSFDPIIKKYFFALMTQGGKDVYPIFNTGDHFAIANQFVSNLINIKSNYLSDEILIIRPGDKIVGLDFLHSISKNSTGALKDAQRRGASILYCALGDAIYSKGLYAKIANLILSWAKESVSNLSFQIEVAARNRKYKNDNSSTIKLMMMASEADIPINILVINEDLTRFVENNYFEGYTIKNASHFLRKLVDEIDDDTRIIY